MKLVNLTPHEICEATTGKKFPASGMVARVSAQYSPAGELDDIPLFSARFGEVEGLPEPQEGVVFIVSSMVLETMRERRGDIVAPGDLVRDQNGNPIGCRGFKK